MNQQSISELVEVYINEVRPCRKDQREEFCGLADATLDPIKAVGLGKCFWWNDHQRHLNRESLKSAAKKLSARGIELRNAQTFDALHDIVLLVAESEPGLGPLYSYDTAVRIGWIVNKEPEAVYLHAGAKKGAQLMGLPRKDKLRRDELPEELAKLCFSEVEDFLCLISKESFRCGLGLGLCGKRGKSSDR